jgi:hypothetical protein
MIQASGISLASLGWSTFPLAAAARSDRARRVRAGVPTGTDRRIKAARSYQLGRGPAPRANGAVRTQQRA